MDYFYRPNINTHGAQNSNQLGTAGLYIPDFRIVFSVQKQSERSYSFRLALAGETHISRGLRVDSPEHLFRVYLILRSFASMAKAKSLFFSGVAINVVN